MKKRRLLNVYRAGLRLYPADFYKAFAEQMLLIAEDALQEALTRRAAAKVVGALIADLLVTAMKENGKNLGGKIVKQARKISHNPKQKLVIWSLQLLGVGISSYIWLAYATININALRRINSDSWSSDYFWTWLAQVATVSIPLVCIPLAFVVLHKASSLSVWRQFTWSYGLGLAGAACYLLTARIANDLSIYYTSRHHDYDWLLGLFFVAGYYLVLQRFQTRIEVAKK